jgi:hypothetical protein
VSTNKAETLISNNVDYQLKKKYTNTICDSVQPPTMLKRVNFHFVFVFFLGKKYAVVRQHTPQRVVFAVRVNPRRYFWIGV